MKEELQKIYPEAEFSLTPNCGPDELAIPVEGGYICLNKAQLTPKETALLALIVPKEIKNNHPWQQILFGNHLPPVGSYRILQFHVLHDQDFFSNEWEQTLKEMFPQMVDFFYLENNDLLLVEKEDPKSFDQQTLAGIFLTLDADFDTTTYLFVGRFFSEVQALKLMFQEERQIFLEEFPYLKEKRVFSLADVALHYFTKDSFSQSQLIYYYRQQLDFDQELGTIIQTLWNNQGNISSTAKELFMHRNTLQYKLDKFQEKSGINLKNTDQLIFCYLLSLSAN